MDAIIYSRCGYYTSGDKRPVTWGKGFLIDRF